MTPEMQAIEARANAARTTIMAVCAKAGVSYSAWYRAAQQGKAIRIRTIGRLEDALTAIERERV